MVYAEPRPERLRIRIFPQSPLDGGAARLETITVSPRAGSVGPGPADRRMYAVEAPGKPPYGAAGRPALPPWTGPAARRARPSRRGHFDHLAPGDPGFRAAHLYGCARFALDVWQGYLGGPIDWHFARHFPQLELVALGAWPNAHMGYGYLEVGQRPLPAGRVADYALNFDVIGHEIGHALMMAFAGRFAPDRVTADYEALHEASADWAAMIASLHLTPVVEELLETTRGDLHTANRLNRFAELSSTRQIRIANNDRTMWDFAAGWSNEHNLALPLIAALFDAFVEVYKVILVRLGAFPRALDDLADMAERDPAWRGRVRAGFARAYARHPERFLAAVAEARAIAATMMVGLWTRADPHGFRLGHIAPILAEIDFEQFGGGLRRIVAGCFARRGIGLVPPGPRLAPPGRDSHLHSERTITVE
ncbi:MAG TPA: hypothetical protein VM891_10035 [Amaricoccus sp.]|nr:hypothetical protein [Amaricoccus sp.]